MKFLCHKGDVDFASTFSKLKIVNKKQEEKERGRGGGWAGDNEVKISCVSLFFSFLLREGGWWLNGRCTRGSDLSLEGILDPTNF